eukprot:TRINITY_DN28101_c0_g1_i1.p1 TRINITY_DN28101_c0_g1~~TRINITY_DN28101_c0_g1_i1.p1  ORF type:complete len:101 (+),score=3.96 TRINITY_DN28101_c0_g1_i1:33-305(+)
MGVWGLPAGETKCLIYLNGPAVAVGVLAATALGGITGTATTVIGTGGLGIVGTSGAFAMGACPAPFFCRVGAMCCLIIIGNNGLRCPTFC